MITQAICWTLLHSLWQGALAALVAGIIIHCTRRSRAVIRYNFLVADLLFFLMVAGCTFFYSLTPAHGGVAPVRSGAAAKPENEVFIRLMP
ncbi:MAG TPA: hypothetical protein VKQ52_00740, partial [Puia sp.]|nr:hypothetical protein [Puia sp.]